MTAGARPKRGFHRDDLAALVDEQILELSPVGVAAAGTRSRPLLPRGGIPRLPNAAAARPGAADGARPDATEHLSGNDDLVVLLGERDLARELGGAVGPGRGAGGVAGPLGAPASHEALRLGDEVRAIDGGALEGVVGAVLAHLRCEAAGVVESLVGSVAVQKLAAVAVHCLGLEGAHGRLLSCST